MLQWTDFETVVPGKWVITGEHAVLRGATAVAAPHPEFRLKLRFKLMDHGPLEIQPAASEVPLRSLLQAIQSGTMATGEGFTWPSGKITIDSNIPEGAGLGSSAALCVAVARWISGPLLIAPQDLMQLATWMEGHFHGQSSGMDISAVASTSPIIFARGRGPRPVNVGKMPNFTFHDTGLRASTRSCVAEVAKLWVTDPARAERIDARMAGASEAAEKGLKAYASAERAAGLRALGEAMTAAQTCFKDWGLSPPGVDDQIAKLKAEGALAVKLTGAGGGGYLVALWE